MTSMDPVRHPHLQARSKDAPLWHGFTNMRKFRKAPICMTEGDGVWLWDSTGKKYLNSFSSLVNLSLGSGQDDLIDRMAAQARKLSYFSIEKATHEIAEEYARRLVEKTPAGLDRVFYASTGAEANESIIKIIRQYQRLRFGNDTEKLEIIALDRGFHGVTLGALSATGSKFAHWRDPFSPLLPGFHHVPSPDSYRCAFDCGGICSLRCANAVRQKIEEIGPERIGGLMIEPVLGVGGVVVPTAEYHRQVRDLCDEFDILLAYDEVITGFGRLGTWFGADYFGVVPDLMALSKGINSGYLPFGAVVLRDEIYQAFIDDDGASFSNGSTTNGSPICCASGLATLDVMERDGIVEKAAAAGEHMFKSFERLKVHPIVGEIRGAGLLLAVELVRDRDTREALPPEQWEFFEAGSVVNGLILGMSNPEMDGTYFLVAPPLTITTDEIDEIHERLTVLLHRCSRLTQTAPRASS